MTITCIFTKEEQREINRLKKQEKEGKDINWEDFLSKRSMIGQQRWKRFKF